MAGSTSIRDVARRAGVSHMTVSRVINGNPGVSEATRTRVMEAVRMLDFRPNRTARDLSLGRSRSVTVMTSDTMLYGPMTLLRGVEEAARKAGYHIVIGMLEAADQVSVRAAVDRSCDSTSAGVIVIAFDLAGVRALRSIRPGIPVVGALQVTDVRDRREFTSTVLDDQGAAAVATRHLLELGHQTVHYVALPSPTRTSGRIRGWRSALQAAGAAVPEPVRAGWTPHSGYEAARQLAADPSVTALLCGNDDLALGALHALREAGRRVPEDVSVIGFDDIPSAAFYPPPLTTVRFDFAGLGHDCFTLLLHALDPGAAEPATVAAAPQLIVRDTTGPAPVTSSR